jgi:hypothetical protein
MASTRGSTDQRARRSTRKRPNLLALLAIVVILVIGGVLLYLNGPQLGPYSAPRSPQSAPAL